MKKISAVPSLTFSFVFALGLMMCAVNAQTVTIHLASNPKEFVRVTKTGGVELTEQGTPTRFKMVEGLIDSSNKQSVSFQLAGKRDHYLRHYQYQIFAHQRPKKDPLFDYDATFIAQQTTKNSPKIRTVAFESANYPKHLVDTKNRAILRISPSPDPESSTFVLRTSSVN
jgi:hypothetical protein